MMATRETRAVWSGPESPAADRATGKPSEAPSPQKRTEAAATAALSEKITRTSPRAPETALARSTVARPKRTRKNVPQKRPRVIAAANPT